MRSRIQLLSVTDGVWCFRQRSYFCCSYAAYQRRCSTIEFIAEAGPRIRVAAAREVCTVSAVDIWRSRRTVPVHDLLNRGATGARPVGRCILS
jgi:hypothetical protein